MKTTLLFGWAAWCLCSCNAAWAQAKKPAPPVNTRTLDAEAAKVEEGYLKGLSDLAKSYEEAGDKEKAKAMLQSILKIRPDLEPVKSKIKEIEESVFQDRQESIDLDVSKGWITSGLLVEKGRKIRIEAIGTYRLTLNEELGPEGIKSPEGQTADFFEGAPAGALIGVVVPAGASPDRRRDGPQPFLVGSVKEFEPTQTGLLLLRINTPPNARSQGRLKLRVSGNIASVSGR